jgi:nitroreductase
VPDVAAGGSDLLKLLETRRSAGLLCEPGPGPAALRRMLTIASRVPDHGALVPWRFIVFQGGGRAAFGRNLMPVYAAWLDAEHADWCQANPEKRAAAVERIAGIFLRAPLVVVVVNRADPAARIPEWEQSLTVGAVCMNLVTAATALGFGSVWLTGWLASQGLVKSVLGLSATERVSGIIHVGTRRESLKDRPRPDLDAIVTHWRDE